MTLALSPAFFDLLAGSYFRLVGERLVPSERDNENAARWLYEEAPYCVLAHSTDPDPIFIYGNKIAQTCFEYTWDELTSLPSRLSAEEQNREERERLLDAVKRHGFATGYRGLRIAKSGRRFWIENVTVWQLVDRAGVLAWSRGGLPAVERSGRSQAAKNPRNRGLNAERSGGMRTGTVETKGAKKI